MDPNGGILAIVALAVIAGGGIIVIDAFVIRKIRRLGPPKDQAPIDRRSDR